jgi:hypothetical protein
LEHHQSINSIQRDFILVGLTTNSAYSFQRETKVRMCTMLLGFHRPVGGTSPKSINSIQRDVMLVGFTTNSAYSFQRETKVRVCTMLLGFVGTSPIYQLYTERLHFGWAHHKLSLLFSERDKSKGVHHAPRFCWNITNLSTLYRETSFWLGSPQTQLTLFRERQK